MSTFREAFDRLNARCGSPTSTRTDDDGMWHAKWTGRRYEVLLWKDDVHGGTAVIEAWVSDRDAGEKTESERWAVSSKHDAPALALAWIAERTGAAQTVSAP